MNKDDPFPSSVSIEILQIDSRVMLESVIPVEYERPGKEGSAPKARIFFTNLHYKMTAKTYSRIRFHSILLKFLNFLN